ncbi:MAG TPA: DNA primase [Spirochaetota bacterium]|nr:DNA primase [Spirochaetota bacterium]HPI89163.1 DNA primase [Spirochaetota bacterium]HPR46842.1 DNA primase [Spirochaetota bacterium]
MYIPRETIEQIRERASIAEIIKRYVPSLQKKGRNHIGLCPFHKEKTPSFTVSEEKNMFHCFGCQASGNVFSFISKIEGLDFPESVKFVAQIVGIDIPESVSSPIPEPHQRDYELNSFCMEIYRSNLTRHKGNSGFTYLARRGVSEKSMQDFKLGFAPDSWDFLTEKLSRSKYDVKHAERIGLVSVSTKTGASRFYDRFRNRIIFPIVSSEGKVVAFGGRIIGDGTPKYLNSPESEIFHKRNILYGMDRARNSIRELKRAIVVEGYLDVIGCHQAGITNVVAPLGTALSENHLTILSRLCSEVVFLFDADSAGIKAAIRSLNIAESISLSVKVAILPQGDPFDYILENGPRPFMAIVDSSLNPVDFHINHIIDTGSHEKPVTLLLKLFSVIKDIKYETEKNIYLKTISQKLMLDENSVIQDFKNYLNNTPQLKSMIRSVNKDVKNDFLKKSYREISRLLLTYPYLVEKAAIDFSAYTFENIEYGLLLKTVLELYRKGESVTVDKMFDFFQDGVELELLNKIALDNILYENPESVYGELYINIKLYDINTKIKKYADLIKSDSHSNKQEYLTEIEVLRREKEKLSNYIYNK